MPEKPLYDPNETNLATDGPRQMTRARLGGISLRTDKHEPLNLGVTWGQFLEEIKNPPQNTEEA
ncbi:hypothetical protein EOL96_06895 [Candidatus Saccharibacteria bacterium]|nr:hypothetical protein [Candidatus Saccharibacteria bacterium]